LSSVFGDVDCNEWILLTGTVPRLL